MEVRGKYEVIGNVLLLPVRSNGDFWAEFCKYCGVGEPPDNLSNLFLVTNS